MVSFESFIHFLAFCDKKMKNTYNMSLKNIIEIYSFDKEEIKHFLYADEDIKHLVNKYNLNDMLESFIDECSLIKIPDIKTDTLELASSRPDDIPDSRYYISEERLDNLFMTLKNNLRLFRSLYENKVWVIDSSIGRKDNISISSTRLFHLLGLDEKDFKNTGAMTSFEQVFYLGDNIRSLMTDRKDLLKVLDKMVEREHLVKEAILEGRIKSVINPYKMEMKNYAFERVGPLDTTSGMVFFDKSIANANGFNPRLNGDLILLSDFIRNYDLDFIFTFYKNYKFNKLGKDGESIFVTGNGYKNSKFLEGQLVSISERATRYKRKDFEFSISLLGSGTPEDVGAEPEEIIEYTPEDKIRMIQCLNDGLPYLDFSHLDEVYDDLKNGNSRRI